MKITDKDSYITETTIVRSFLEHPEVPKYEQINAFGIAYFLKTKKNWLDFCLYLTSVGRLIERFETTHNKTEQGKIMHLYHNNQFYIVYFEYNYPLAARIGLAIIESETGSVVDQQLMWMS